MATKSILKSITIKDRHSATALVSALEHASGKKSKPVVLSRPFITASKDEIQKMFGTEE